MGGFARHLTRRFQVLKRRSSPVYTGSYEGKFGAVTRRVRVNTRVLALWGQCLQLAHFYDLETGWTRKRLPPLLNQVLGSSRPMRS